MSYSLCNTRRRPEMFRHVVALWNLSQALSHLPHQVGNFVIKRSSNLFKSWLSHLPLPYSFDTLRTWLRQKLSSFFLLFLISLVSVVDSNVHVGDNSTYIGLEFLLAFTIPLPLFPRIIEWYTKVGK